MRIEPSYAASAADDPHRVEALADPFAQFDARAGSRRQRVLDILAILCATAASVAVVANALVMQPPGRPAGLAAAGGPRTTVAVTGPRAGMSAPAGSGDGGLGYLGARTTLTSTAAPITRPASPVVSDVQRELARRGFYDGPVDGLSGPRTEAAVRAFEQSAKLSVTGEPNDALLAQLRRAPVPAAAPSPPPAQPLSDITGAVRPPAPVEGSPRVLGVQQALARLGYGPFKVDGRPGPSTRQAIQKFERDRGLPADGEITDRLVKELSKGAGTAIE